MAAFRHSLTCALRSRFPPLLLNPKPQIPRFCFLLLTYSDHHDSLPYPHSTSTGESGTAATAIPVSPTESIQRCRRVGEVKRVSKETDVYVKINLDGSVVSDCRTGIPFLDHMLDANGDTHIDDHHTNEDVALAIGTALLQAHGDRQGIYRTFPSEFRSKHPHSKSWSLRHAAGRTFLSVNGEYFWNDASHLTDRWEKWASHHRSNIQGIC